MRKGAEASRRADDASAELDKLRRTLDGAPNSDPCLQLRDLLCQISTQKTKELIAFIRSKIPADHPALPWFDRTIDTATKLGCVALKASCAFVVWAKPRVIEAYNFARSEIEKRLDKK